MTSTPWLTDGPPSSPGTDLGEVWPGTVSAPGYHMCTRMASLDAAPLHGAPVVGRLVVLLAEGAPGGCRGAVGGDVAPPTAPAAGGVWSGLLEGLDLVTGAR